MQVHGGCHCGAIAFEAEVDPELVRICHGTDCQQLSGTAFRVTALCQEEDFRLLRGTPKIYVKIADSGRRRQQLFCGECGASLYTTSDEPPGRRRVGLRVGALAERNLLVPRAQYFERSPVPWLPEMPGTVHWDDV